MVQYSISSGCWEAVDKGKLILKGWSTTGLKAGDSFRRELLNCLVEVQPQQNGIWVLEKVDVEELKRLIKE
jgi:hypothetical protein